MKNALRRTHAFTLIELLVVITILGILIAMLLPSLGQARAVAQSVQCLSNQRQIGVALRGYVNDSRDYWMIATYPYCGHAEHYSPTWAAIAANYGNQMYNTEYTANATAYPDWVKFTSFYETKKKNGILKCPTVPITVTNTWGGVISTNYGYNSYPHGLGLNDYYTNDSIAVYGASAGPIYKKYYGRVRTQEIILESSTILVAEGQHQGGFEYGGSSVGSAGPSGLDILHTNNTSNILYTDGHANTRNPVLVSTSEFVRFPQ
jgi:prepilin-type N-terminal cleavage/methylation domain-containing protein/prepilin-type processing-associated H-X9-DG protein